MLDLLKIVAGLAGSLGMYVLYDRWLVQRRAERAEYAAKWRTPEMASRRWPPLRVLMVVLPGGAILFFGIRYLQTRHDAAHPAAEEHRAELLDLAAYRMNCGKETLTIYREQDPRRARVQGCGQTVTFRYSALLRRASPQTYTAQQWHEIDPNCRVDYMGCAMPCE